MSDGHKAAGEEEVLGKKDGFNQQQETVVEETVPMTQVGHTNEMSKCLTFLVWKKV